MLTVLLPRITVPRITVPLQIQLTRDAGTMVSIPASLQFAMASADFDDVIAAFEGPAQTTLFGGAVPGSWMDASFGTGTVNSTLGGGGGGGDIQTWPPQGQEWPAGQRGQAIVAIQQQHELVTQHDLMTRQQNEAAAAEGDGASRESSMHDSSSRKYVWTSITADVGDTALGVDPEACDDDPYLRRRRL